MYIMYEKAISSQPVIKTHPKNLPVWVVAAGVVAERVEAVVAVTEAVGGASRATG